MREKSRNLLGLSRRWLRTVIPRNQLFPVIECSDGCAKECLGLVEGIQLEIGLTSLTYRGLPNDHKRHDPPSRLHTPGWRLEFASEAILQGYRMRNGIYRL